MSNNINFFGVRNLFSRYDFRDKSNDVNYYLSYMLNRTSQIFEYENLPETMPKRYIELYLQINGHICVAEYEGNLYCFFGGFSGEPNAYYLPTQYVVANPYLKLNKIYNIGEDCIIVPNDTLYMGLLPLFRRYATQLVENDLSINIASINSRIISVISANDDATKDSAELYLKKVCDGDLGVISNTPFIDGLKTQPYSNSGMSANITQLIELEQYLKASWFNEIGLNANYNMKREAINSNESQLNDDMLLPLIDDMYEQRKMYFEKVNEMFGTNIKVRFSSSWEDNRQELFFEQEAMINQSETDNETIDETEDETIDETEDETIDETEDETIDETEDETIDETEDETIEESESESMINQNEDIEDVLEGIEDDLERIADALEGGEDNEDIPDIE